MNLGSCKHLDTVADIKKQRLAWIAHVERIDQGRTVTKIFESERGRSRKRERPRLRWLEDVEEDLREIKVKRW